MLLELLVFFEKKLLKFKIKLIVIGQYHWNR